MHHQQVTIGIHQTRLETALQQRPAAHMSLVEVLHIVLPTLPHGRGQPLCCRRCDQKMDVIAHQHERVNGNRLLAAGIAQQAQVVMPVFIVDEQCSAIDPTLYDVKRDARENQASGTGHGRQR
ncbi:hypothetical protein D3C71_1381660 [compost metagenome]